MHLLNRFSDCTQVKPVMNRLKQTLIGAGALLATATVALVVLLPTQQDIGTVMYPPARHGSDSAIAAEGKVYRYVHIFNTL